MKRTGGDVRQRARIHGLDVIWELQMLHAAVGRDDALLDVVAPHLSVNKLPQKMRVHYRKFWGDDERGPFLGYDSVGTHTSGHDATHEYVGLGKVLHAKLCQRCE